MDAITIPVRRPLTFDSLKELNPEAQTEELVDAFQALPASMREQAWEDLRLRTALDDWNRAAEATP